jgi:hypothetical protein
MKKIVTVGLEVPGGEVEEVDILSKRSLLDSDIIVFSPAIPNTYGSDTYLGKESLSDDSSFRVRETLTHWRRELAGAFDAGKLIIALLPEPEVVYAATGEKKYSGTGRNARVTRIVEELGAYSALPVEWRYQTASGTEMSIVSEARFFAPYWAEFAKYSRYEVYLEWKSSEPLVKTRTGNRVVGACVRKGRGALLAVPNLYLDDEDFWETRKEDGKQETYWTKNAETFGKRFASMLVALADALASEVAITPPPAWTQDDAYRLAEEADIERNIESITAQVVKFEERRREIEAQLEAVGALRRLLFEQGKPLEDALLQGLGLLGFEAQGFRENGSEFDAVFVSPEGRFIGEVEGKDNRSINIDKFSQLERNLNEDFARDGVDQFAKGVLFGNAYRLRSVDARADPFTEKCRTAAKRLGVALVHTPDLFEPCRYLKNNSDIDYARECRETIFRTVGDIVVFPAPPVSVAADVCTEVTTAETKSND